MFFVAAVVVFLWFRIDKSIDYLSGRKKKRTVRKAEKIKNVIYISVWILAGTIFPEEGKEVYGYTVQKAKEVHTIRLSPVGGQTEAEGTVYYNEGVYGTVQVNERFLREGLVRIYAVPKDETAQKTVEQSDFVDNKGNLEIPGWITSGEGEVKTVRFSFGEQGRWKIVFHSQINHKTDEGIRDNINSREADNAEDVDEQEIYEAVSKEHIIDKKSPELEVTYHNRISISNVSSSPSNINRKIKRGMYYINSPECEIFTQGTGQAEIEITEDYFAAENVKINLLKENYAEKKTVDVTDKYRNSGEWIQKRDKMSLCLSFEEEGHYYIQIQYKDYGGRNLTAKKGSETEACMEEGEYKGPVYTVDTTRPLIKEFNIRKQKEYKSNVYEASVSDNFFVEPPEILLEIEEENFNCGDFSFNNRAEWADGSLLCPEMKETDYDLVWTSSYEKGKRINRTVVKLEKEANYFFAAETRDGGGWKSGSRKGKCTYDKTAPELNLVITEPSLYYPYTSYQYFSQDKIRIGVKANDKVSGVKAIRYYCVDYTGNKGKELLEEGEKQEGEKNQGEWEIWITADAEDFKGKVYVQAEDSLGHKSPWTVSPGIIEESKIFHKQNSRLNVMLSEADYTDEANKIKYYRDSAEITMTAEDRQSGIKTLVLLAGTDKKIEKKKQVSDKDIVSSDSLKMKVKSEDFSGINRNNPIIIRAVLRDNAGNQSVKTITDYKIILDNQAPEVRVKYDINRGNNTGYYNHTRIAEVTVKDENFHPDNVNWMISGSNDKYQISDWTKIGQIHHCKVKFSEDGEGYRLKLAVTDEAGNRTLWDEDQLFTIDKTPPKVKLMMNKHRAVNGKYYPQPEKVVFQIEEKNLDKNKIIYKIGGTDNDNREKGKGEDRKKGDSHRDGARKLPIGFFDNGKYISVVSFNRDGNYQVAFRCRDMAGNVSSAVRPLKFIIDSTAPRIQVSGVEEGMSYQGDLFPKVKVSDKNINENTIRVKIIRIDEDSEKNIIDNTKKEKILHEAKMVGIKGKEFSWEAFPHQEKWDGHYVLKAFAEDMAGNSCSTGEGIPFSINRFGASFHINKGLKTILASGYMRQEEDILITEKSVILSDVNVSIVKDNQIKKEIVPEIKKDAVQKEDEKKGWQVNTYCIGKENFQEEGLYRITVYSTGYIVKQGEKQVIKETNSNVRGRAIQFTVDKTPPVVRLSGLNHAVYKGKQHYFTVTVMDNYEFSRMELTIYYGNKREAVRKIILTPEDLHEGHSKKILLKAYNGKQTIGYRVWDKAGNYRTTSQKDLIDCVITENEAVQMRYERPEIFWMAVIVLAVAVLAIAAVIFAKISAWRHVKKTRL